MYVNSSCYTWKNLSSGGEIKPLETVYQPTVNTIGKFRIDVSFKEEEAESCLKCIRSIENVEITSTFRCVPKLFFADITVFLIIFIMFICDSLTPVLSSTEGN